MGMRDEGKGGSLGFSEVLIIHRIDIKEINIQKTSRRKEKVRRHYRNKELETHSTSREMAEKLEHQNICVFKFVGSGPKWCQRL